MIQQDGKWKQQIITIPNLLSLFRLCLIPVCVWLYCAKKDYVLTTLVLILSGLTDVVDGFIARRFNMISDVGKVLDPIADKLTQGVMLICLVTRYQRMLIPLLMMIAKELFAGISGFLVIRKTKMVHGADWHGKAATVALYLMMIVHLLWVNIPISASSLFIGICTAAIALSFILYGLRNIRLILQNTQHV